MQWSDLPLRPSPRTLRQFAGLWIVFFAAAAAIQTFVKGHLLAGKILAILAVTVGPGGLIAPALIRPVFVTWLVIGFPVGWLLSRVLLAIMFYGIGLPVAIYFRLRGRDALLLKRPAGARSYWQPKTAPTDAATYFRQY